MRRLTFLAVGLVVLATAGLAVAKGLEATKSIKSVTGTFTAATVQPIGKATSCTTSDGKTLVTAKARYSGVAAGDGNLAGAITLDARIVANATDNIGVVDGKLRIHVASGGETTARFTGVLASGKLVGFATGHTQDPHAKLFANFSSGFAPCNGVHRGQDRCHRRRLGRGGRAGEVRSQARRCRPGGEEGSRQEGQGRREGQGRQEALDEARTVVRPPTRTRDGASASGDIPSRSRTRLFGARGAVQVRSWIRSMAAFATVGMANSGNANVELTLISQST